MNRFNIDEIDNQPVLSQIEFERLYSSVVLSSSSELDRISIIEFECYLDAMWIKLSRSLGARDGVSDQLEKIERMKSLLNQSKDVIDINKIQSKIISKLRVEVYRLKLENSKLIDIDKF